MSKRDFTKYIHIGFPKNFSTSLQRGFFSEHPQIMHLGIGCQNNNTKYYNEKLTAFMEMYVRYSKNFIYEDNEVKIKEEFNKLFQIAENDKNIKAVGISAEILSISFSPQDVDVVEKANRMKGIFGEGTKIIIFIRNQMDLLQSFYRECVRVGYPYSYKTFLDYQYKYHAKAFSSDFLYDKSIKLYSQLFGKENVIVIPYESVKDLSNGQLIKENKKLKILNTMCEFLNIDYVDLKFEYHNASISDSETVYKQELNQKYPHDISNITYDFIESHRLNDYFENELKISHFKPDFHDVKIKRKSLTEALEMTNNMGKRSIDYSCDEIIRNRLYMMYAESNRKLMQMTSLDLTKYNYPF